MRLFAMITAAAALALAPQLCVAGPITSGATTPAATPLNHSVLAQLNATLPSMSAKQMAEVRGADTSDAIEGAERIESDAVPQARYHVRTALYTIIGVIRS